MRICILSYRSYPYSGGQGIYMRYLSNALRDLGHEVDMMSGPPYPIVDDGVGLIKLPSLDLYTFGSWQRLFIDPRKLNTYPNFMEWGGIVTGYFSEPLAFGMRAYQYLCRNGRKKYDVIHDNQTLSYGMADIEECGYPMVETIHHPVTIDRDMVLPFLGTILVGVPLLRAAAHSGRRPIAQAALFGAALPIAFAPFLSLTGDYYEMGSIVVSRVVAWLTPGFAVTRWRSDDLLKLGGQLFGSAGTGTAGDAAGVTTSFVLGVALAFLTYAAGGVWARVIRAGEGRVKSFHSRVRNPVCRAARRYTEVAMRLLIHIVTFRDG